MEELEQKQIALFDEQMSLSDLSSLEIKLQDELKQNEVYQKLQEVKGVDKSTPVLGPLLSPVGTLGVFGVIGVLGDLGFPGVDGFPGFPGVPGFPGLPPLPGGTTSPGPLY